MTLDRGSLHGTPPWSSIAKRNYQIIAHGVSGMACKETVLGIPISRKRLKDAYTTVYKLANGHAQNREYALINVVHDTSYSFYVVYAESCDIITADVALLKEPVPDAYVFSGGGNEAPPAPPPPLPGS
jgi:hypothetical protein